jgi:KRAB domain-containing zinc finger protein
MHLMNTRDDKLACKLCNEKFTRRMLLDDHNMQVHGLPSELPFNCSDSSCSKKFSSQLTLRQHEKTHTKELPEDLSVQCDQCDKRFPTKTRLSGHILSAHVVEKNFICDKCGNGFKTKGALTDHQNSHKKELIFKCDQCPKAFKHLRGIKRHLDRHNRTEKFICAICQASLSSKDVLQVHMLIHSDEKRFKCHLCTNAYKRTKNLKIHIMSVHTGGTPQYQCPWCDRFFYDGSNCYKHRKNAHPVEFAASQGQEVKKTFLPKLEHLQPQ